jgi:hypothetical protein
MKNLKNHQSGKSLSENKVLNKADLEAWKEEREEKKNLDNLTKA